MDRQKNEHVQLFLDNTVAIKYLSKMGGRERNLNSLARDIWCWCEERNNWLSIFHIAGSLNILADALSRAGKKLNDGMEWALNSWVFDCIQRKMGTCHIDLFASSKNFKLEQYVSYLPDNGAFAVNTFSLSWNNNLQMYAFPPFHVIGHLLQKLREDMSQGPSWGSKLGSKFSLGGDCVSALRLAKVVGNLAQAKTGSTQDPFCI